MIRIISITLPILVLFAGCMLLPAAHVTTEQSRYDESERTTSEPESSPKKVFDECTEQYDPTSDEVAFVDAAQAGDLPAISAAIDRGINVNAKGDTHGLRSAIALAAIKGHVEVVELLLEAGADPDATRCGLTTDTWTRRWIRGEALINATFNDDLEILLLLVSAGAAIDEPDSKGDNALLWAAYNLNSAAVQYLLGVGADPHHTNHSGQNALDYANLDWLFATKTNEEKAETIRVLLQAGVGPGA